MADKKKASPGDSAGQVKTPSQEARCEATAIERLAELARQSTALARLVARNPSASADLLEVLGSHSDASVRKWVVLHPNTPTKVLAKLATQFPEELLDNPIFDVLLLENPNLLSELPVGTRRSLLKRQKCPVSFLEWLALDADEGVQLALAMNPNTPTHVLRKLAEGSRANVARAARCHVNYAPRQRHEQDPSEDGARSALAEEALSPRELEDARTLLPWLIAHGPATRQVNPLLANWARHQLWRAWADASFVPRSAFGLLAQDEQSGVRLRLARNPRATPAVLKVFARDESLKLRSFVASNTSTPAAALEMLAMDKNPQVRNQVVGNESTPGRVLHALIRDKSSRVRRSVASNKSTPSTVLEMLGVDKNPELRSCVAGNASAPESLLQGLARDKHADVRSCVAGNESTPKHLLESLARDRDSRVRGSVAKNESTPRPLLEKLANSGVVRGCVAGNRSTPKPVLEMLSKARSWWIRMCVAGNESTPKPALELLARAKDWNTRRAVASNKSAPKRALEILAGDWVWEVRRCVAENASTPEHVRQMLVGDNVHIRRRIAKLEQREVERFAQSKVEEMRRAIALAELPRSARLARRKVLTQAFVARYGRSNLPSFRRLLCLLLPDCPIPVLARAVRSSDWKERLAVASHPDTPPAIRQRLANDGNEFVRAAGQRMLVAEGEKARKATRR